MNEQPIPIYFCSHHGSYSHHGNECPICGEKCRPVEDSPAEIFHDKIEHPLHYTWHPSGVECHQIAEEFPYNLGVAIAYIWRFPITKNRLDLDKAIKHLEFEKARSE